MSFEGKVLFATGGGSGIAAATARRFTAGGGRVAVVDLVADRAEAVAAELDGAIGLAADVADEDSVRAAVDTAGAELGRIDCLLSRRPRGVRADRRVADRTLEPDDGRARRGEVLVCKYAAPIPGWWGGSIVNIASTPR